MTLLALVCIFSLRVIYAVWTPETIVAKAMYIPTLNSTAYVGITYEALCSSGQSLKPTPGNEAADHFQCQTVCFNKCPTNSLLASSYGSDAANEQYECLKQEAAGCHFIKYEVMLLPMDLACAKSGGMMQLRLPPDLSYILYHLIDASEALHVQFHVSSQTLRKDCDSGTLPYTIFAEVESTNRCIQYGSIPSSHDAIGNLKFLHVTPNTDKSSTQDASLMVLDVPVNVTVKALAEQSLHSQQQNYFTLLPFGCCSQSPVLNETMIGGVFKLFTGPSKDQGSLNSEGDRQTLGTFSALLCNVIVLVMFVVTSTTFC